MAILYTCSNTNLNTVKLVAIAVKSLSEHNESPPVSKVVIFSLSEETKDDIFAEQAKIYEKVFGKSTRTEKVPLAMNGLGDTDGFTEVFKADGLKYVDLTNGQKSITSQLYLTASLLRVENIYYVSLLCPPKELPDMPIWGQHYEYVKLPPFTGISSISKLSYFDLVFYLEEIEEIFANTKNNLFLHKISDDLKKSVLSFFQGDNFRSAISDSTTSSEVFINELLIFLQVYPVAQEFSSSFGIDLRRQKDPLGAITFFFKIYSEKSCNNRNYVDENLEVLSTIPGLLTSLRMFRNIAAHSGISSHKFKADEVRICINLALECFRCAKTSKEFWKRLLAR